MIRGHKVEGEGAVCTEEEEVGDWQMRGNFRVSVV